MSWLKGNNYPNNQHIMATKCPAAKDPAFGKIQHTSRQPMAAISPLTRPVHLILDTRNQPPNIYFCDITWLAKIVNGIMVCTNTRVKKRITSSTAVAKNPSISASDQEKRRFLSISWRIQKALQPSTGLNANAPSTMTCCHHATYDPFQTPFHTDHI